jgi:SAM-dependent methyltransferase
MEKSEIESRVKELSKKEEWNHSYELPYDIRTRHTDVDSPGYNPNKWKRLEPILDSIGIENKSVLDIGCSDGYFSIECARKTSESVLGIDLDPLRIERANFINEVFGLSNVKFDVVDLYDIPENGFDVVLGLGLLHRVPDIDLCLKRIAAIGQHVLLEFKTLDDERPILEESGGKTKSNEYNKLYSIPTQSYVINKMGEFGMKNYLMFDDEQSNLKYKRTIVLFSREKLDHAF